MFRSISARLDAWLESPGRRPLVLRGARQVGKTWLVRDLAARAGLDLVELNFERNPELTRAFASNDPLHVVGELSLLFDRDVTPSGSLLFLDEIQAAGALLAKLRWFFEELPELAVVAAGSLLELTLADHAFSMPVGRVSFLHVEPMSFPEYLLAHGQERLLSTLKTWAPGQALSPTAHERATEWFHRYSMVGGMPAVVQADVAGLTPRECRALQADLVATYRADFAKYAGRMDRDILSAVLAAVAASLGTRFVYSRAGEGVRHHQAKAALERLADARICHLVRHTAARGLPLAAEVKEHLRKTLLLDVGLLHALRSTPAAQAFPRTERLAPSFRGQIAEQIVGQQLRLTVNGGGDGPELYYWQSGGGRPGEIDFVIQLQGIVVPVEVKSGAAGSMKSLHQFMHDRGLTLAVRCDANPPSRAPIALRTTRGQPVEYVLLSLPLYLCWSLGALLERDPAVVRE